MAFPARNKRDDCANVILLYTASSAACNCINLAITLAYFHGLDCRVFVQRIHFALAILLQCTRFFGCCINRRQRYFGRSTHFTIRSDLDWLRNHFFVSFRNCLQCHCKTQNHRRTDQYCDLFPNACTSANRNMVFV